MNSTNSLDKLIESLRRTVREQALDPSFVHHKWYVKYHLELVEKIGLELCDSHREADRCMVIVLVWLHDYGKVLGKDKLATLLEGRRLLETLRFPHNYIHKIVEYVAAIDARQDLDVAPIEVRIVSSADAAAHVSGPFYLMWWYENGNKSIEQLISASKKKLTDDWTTKIVLPEVKKAFQSRFDLIHEMLGDLPVRFMPSVDKS